MYHLGIDLGETSVKAALVRGDGSLALAPTGEHSFSVPTVAGVGGAVTLVGDAAVEACRAHPECRREALWRGLSQPHPVAAGEPTVPDLLAELADAAVAAVSARLGGPPDRIVLTCPASAPVVRRRVTEQLAERWRAGPGAPPVWVIDESDAVAAYAAASFPALADRRDGVLVVCDLGGGSCEVTVLRSGGGRFGVDAVEGTGFGGLDLDEVLVRYVDARVGDRLDPAETAVLARWRLDCRAARTRLSEVLGTVVPVSTPEGVVEVDLSREQLESMASPGLRASLGAARRTRAATDEEPRVLLLGGLSRMPLVARIMAAELGRPVFPDPDHVEHGVALGAALVGFDGAPATGAGAPSVGTNDSFVASIRTNESFVPNKHEPEPEPAVTPALPTDAWSQGRARRRVPVAGVVAACLVVAAIVAVGWLAVGIRAGGESAPPVAAPVAAPPAAPTTTPPAFGPAPTGVAGSSPLPTLAASTVPVDQPSVAVVSPNGRLVYVGSTARREIAVIDTVTAQVIGTIPLPLPPRYLTVAPDGVRVYAALSDDARTRFALASVDPVANRVEGAIRLGSRPFAPAASPDGRVVWVPEHEAGVVRLLDTRNGAEIRSIPVGASPHAVALSADGTRAYVSLEERDEVLELDTATGAEISRVATGGAPYLIALHPTRPLAVVSNYAGGSVTIIDTLENETVDTVATGAFPQGVAWSPDGWFAYVVNSADDTVSVVDAATLRVTTVVRVPPGPTSLTLLPDGTRGYLTAPGSDVLAGLDLAG